MRYRLSILALFLVASPAAASVTTDLATIEKTMGTCIDADSSNMNMKMCSGTAYEAADKVLNTVYAAAVAPMKGPKADADSKEILDRIVTSERAWITYRDAECKLQGIDMLGGSGETLEISDCLYKMTSDRAKSLDAMFGDK